MTLVVDPLAALDRNRDELRRVVERLRFLYETVASPRDMHLGDLVLFYLMAMEARPDLILEVGRGNGNSTCTFTEYANQAGDCRVKSFCLEDAWDVRTKGLLAPRVGAEWFQPLDARQVDFLGLDLEEILRESTRVVFYWDAHSATLANFVVEHLFPMLAQRESLVIVHDVEAISETRRQRDRYYDSSGNRIWWIAPWMSVFEELLQIVDFCSRNGIRASSPSESRIVFDVRRKLAELGAGDQGGYFMYFALPTRQALTFPPAIPRGPALMELAGKELRFIGREFGGYYEVGFEEHGWADRVRKNEDSSFRPLRGGGVSLVWTDLGKDAPVLIKTYGPGGSVCEVDVETGRAWIRFQSTDSRDHLATEFVELPNETESLHFSVWTKSSHQGEATRLVLQDENFRELAAAKAALKTRDGWTWLLGVQEDVAHLRGGKVRLVAQPGGGQETLLTQLVFVSLLQGF
jgi:hypothetical protein